MSSQKKQSLWQRLKQLVTDAANTRQHQPVPIKHTDKDPKSVDKKATSSVVTDIDPYANPQRESIHNVDLSTGPHFKSDSPKSHGFQPNNSETSSSVYNKDEHKDNTDNSSSDKPPSKFVSLSNLDASDNMKRRSSAYKNSDKPITDAVLDFLEASDLSYYYHHQQNQQQSQQQSKPQEQSDSAEPKDNPSQNRSSQNQQDHDDTQQSTPTVHHISMAMRYYNDADNTANEHASDSSEPLDDSLDDLSTTNLNNLEWGCVIRIHEHTQLIAIYGVLPFQLPPSHLQAGMTLATQLNYDMMLGSIEIDIRDGEIRLKNSLDLEPIINTSGGIVPPAVINYLLKGLMAMTASFAPLFHDLINSDPEKFELEHLLAQLQKDQAENRFYLATTTPQ